MKHYRNTSCCYACLICLFLLSFMSLFPENVRTLAAAQVTLQWSPNSEPDISGYTVYYGISSRSYNRKIDAGKNTTAAVSALSEGMTYYFTVTAYNSQTESSYSNEVSFNTPALPVDTDADGIPDIEDNCPDTANTDQADTDLDGTGNACEQDTDHDGIIDDDDACPADPEKSDPGDCGCGRPDSDSDGDAIADCSDNCPSVFNPAQADHDNNGIGNDCEEQLLFYDDFSSIDYSGWLMPLGTWKITGGTFAQTYSRGRAIAVVKDSAVQDYSFSADVKISSAGQSGLVFRYKDTRNYYCFYQNAGGARLIKYVNGKTKYLTSFKDGLVVPGQTYKFTVTTRGSILECFIDDWPVFRVADTSLSTGKTGLYSNYNGSAVFDEVFMEQ